MTPQELLVWTERRICFALAGGLAQRLACERARNPRWFRMHYFRSETATAFHEAGHLCLANCYDWHIYSATVIPDGNAEIIIGKTVSHRGNSGSVSVSVNPIKVTPDASTEPVRPTLSDMTDAVRWAYLISPGLGWKPTLQTIRRLKARTRGILIAHWSVVSALANALEERQVLTGEEIQAVIANSPKECESVAA